jgi:CHAD domain-containing protein
MLTVDEMLPASRLRKRIRTLRVLLKAFNDLRDVQVQILTVRSMRRRFPVLNGYAAELRHRQMALIRKGRVVINKIPRQDLVKGVGDAGESLFAFYGGPGARRAAAGILVGSAAVAFGKVLERRGDLSSSDPRSIHRMRVAFKRFRYTVELARPLLPWADRKHGKAMDAFQTEMGDIQDLEVLTGNLREFALLRPRGTTSAFLPVFQYLSMLRKKKVDAFLRSADDVQSLWC